MRTLFLTLCIVLMNWTTSAAAAQSVDSIIEELAEARSQLVLAQERLKQAQALEPDDEELAQLERSQAMAQAKAAILEAQLKEYIAQQKYDDAIKEEQQMTEGETVHQQAVADAEAARKLSEAEEAAAKASKAAAQAKEAAISAKTKAILGDVPKSSIEGTVTLGTKGGEAEATLLVAKAMRDLAQKIAGPIASKAANKLVWLVSDDAVPDMYNKLSFLQQSKYVIQAQETAIDASAELNGKLGQPIHVEAVPVAAIAAGVEAFANLGSFFKSDYSSNSVDLNNFGDGPLIDALAGELAKRDISVLTPNTYHPALPAFDPDRNPILRALTDITEKKASLISSKASWEGTLVERQQEIEAKEAEVKKAKEQEPNAGSPTTSDVKQLEIALKALKTTRAEIQNVIGQISAAITAADGFLSGWSSTREQDGSLMRNLILSEYMSAQLKQGNLMLVVNLSAAKGSHYTKKNLWTFFGSMPFYHMGGAVVNYSLLDGPTGKVLAADTVIMHGGFHKSSKVKDYLETEK